MVHFILPRKLPKEVKSCKIGPPSSNFCFWKLNFSPFAVFVNFFRFQFFQIQLDLNSSPMQPASQRRTSAPFAPCSRRQVGGSQWGWPCRGCGFSLEPVLNRSRLVLQRHRGGAQGTEATPRAKLGTAQPSLNAPPPPACNIDNPSLGASVFATKELSSQRPRTNRKKQRPKYQRSRGRFSGSPRASSHRTQGDIGGLCPG